MATTKYLKVFSKRFPATTYCIKVYWNYCVYVTMTFSTLKTTSQPACSLCYYACFIDIQLSYIQLTYICYKNVIFNVNVYLLIKRREHESSLLLFLLSRVLMKSIFVRKNNYMLFRIVFFQMSCSFFTRHFLIGPL